MQFIDVTFAYPTATAFKTLNKLSLDVKPGQVCALCGPSGSGKSTVIALLQVGLTRTRTRIQTRTLLSNPSP